MDVTRRPPASRIIHRRDCLAGPVVPTAMRRVPHVTQRKESARWIRHHREVRSVHDRHGGALQLGRRLDERHLGELMLRRNCRCVGIGQQMVETRIRRVENQASPRRRIPRPRRSKRDARARSAIAGKPDRLRFHHHIDARLFELARHRDRATSRRRTRTRGPRTPTRCARS